DELRERLAEVEKSRAASNDPPGDPPTPPKNQRTDGAPEDPASPPLSRLLSAADLTRILSARLGRPCGGVDSFLARYRKEHLDGFEAIDGRRMNEPRIMYRTADVWPVLWEKYSRKK